MSLETPAEGRCNYPLKYICKKCGKIVKKKTDLCKCGGELKPHSYCGNGAGKGTDHKGKGCCYHHDPDYESISVVGRLDCARAKITHGGYSKYVRNMLLNIYGDEFLEVLDMVEKDPDQLMHILTAKSALLYSRGGDPRQANVTLQLLKEMVKTEKERRASKITEEKEAGDLAEIIVDKYISIRMKEEKEGKASKKKKKGS